jgi:hypothetical protein
LYNFASGVLFQPQARVHQAELERNAAERALERHSPTPTATQPDSIPRPSNLSKVTVRLLRQHLDLEGAEHKKDWLCIRVSFLHQDSPYSRI